MSESNLTVEKDGESDDERSAIESIANRIEGIVSMGPPSCDACLALDSERHPEDAEVWPNPATIFVDVESETMAQWMHKTLCDAHDPAIGNGEGVAVEATHRIRARPELADGKWKFRYNVLSVKEVDW